MHHQARCMGASRSTSYGHLRMSSWLVAWKAVSFRTLGVVRGIRGIFGKEMRAAFEELQDFIQAGRR